jgi:predicted O-methyltransferase YrrM
MNFLFYKVLGKLFNFRNEEVPSFLLHELVHQGENFLPFTTSSLKFRALACICNDLVVNQRKNYLEFGAGLSTILVARLIKKNGLKAHVYSLEEDKGWIEYIQHIIDKEGLTQFVTLFHLPTYPSSSLSQAYLYDFETLKSQLDSSTHFDIILVDGPAAWEKHKVNSRLGNAQFIANAIAPEATVFIDNANREGEKKLVAKLSQDCQVKPIYIDPTFAVLVKGKHYNFIV